MKAIILAAMAMLISGCVTTYQENKDGQYGYLDKKLGDGVYFVRYSDIYFWSVSDGKSGWKRRAAGLCAGEEKYDSLAYAEYIEDLGFSNQISFFGGYPVAYAERESAAVSEGVVRCQNSSLSDTDVRNLLVEKNPCQECKFGTKPSD